MNAKAPEFIADGGSPFIVYKDGHVVSSHNTQRKAASVAGTQKVMFPNSTVEFHRNLVMRVELVDAVPPEETDETLDPGVASFTTGSN